MKKTVVIVTLLLCTIGAGVLLFKTNHSTPMQNSAAQKTTPAILDEKFQRPDDLTDSEKSKIDHLFKKSDIVILGTVRASKPEETAFPRAVMVIDEIYKHGSTSSITQEALRQPILIQSGYPSNPYYFRKENLGNKFLVYGTLSKPSKRYSAYAIGAYAAYVVAKPEDIENATADIVFLGKSTKSSWSAPNHHLFRTVKFDVIKTSNEQIKLPPITIRYSYTNGTTYKLTPINISDVEKSYWISADKIPGTDHYDGMVIGAELSKDIKYLQHKKENTKGE